MIARLADRPSLTFAPLLTAAALFGALASAQPMLALGALGGALVVLLAFAAPAAHLALIVFVTAIVPFELQNRVGIGGGSAAAGLLFSDVLILTGLARAAFVLAQQRLEGRRLLAVGLLSAFLCVAFAQFVHGVRAGANASTAGAEFRVLLGFGTLIVALPVLSDLRQQARLLQLLALVGLALGLWGVAQWVFSVGFGEAGDAGVREGVSFTSSGRGQVQGGLYAFSVAILLATAALMSGRSMSLLARALLVVGLGLNSVSLLLTYERTFWVVTALGLCFVGLKAEPAQRQRALVWGPAALVLTLGALAIVSPGEVTAARERLVSLTQYDNDNSVRYRLVESRHVLREIAERPLTGSGLGATIWWGRPWEQVPPATYSYSHNGYLWLAWKLGVPGAALLFALLALAVAWRGPVRGTPLLPSVRTGAQASLLALLVATLTFPSVSALAITATMGLLAGICALPREPAPG